MSFFVSVANEDRSQIDPERFHADFEASWPDVELERIDDPSRTYALEWSDGDLDGRVARTGAAVVLDGPIEEAARYALWLRSWLPPDVTLVFHDDGYTNDVTLELDTTERDLIEAFA
jgi:hypothetical protein